MKTNSLKAIPSLPPIASTWPQFWSRYASVFLTIALFLVSIGLYSFDWHLFLRGGVSTVGAERVLYGDIPHRDFWTMYAPGHYYLLALIFKLFGTRLIVEVIAGSVICAIATCICYWLVISLEGSRILSLICAGVFFAATYNAGYFHNLGAYPPAILLIFILLTLLVLHFKTDRMVYLAGAGLSTGALIIEKHDVAAYTAIAVTAGLALFTLLVPGKLVKRVMILGRKLAVYGGSMLMVALPAAVYFVIKAGPDMLQNLIIYPSTDFRYARPEAYPSLLPNIPSDPSFLKMLFAFFYYLNFAIPFFLILLGLLAMVWAILKRQAFYAGLALTFSVAYFFHYLAAHIQINTHIISMSVYGALSGLIFYHLASRELSGRWRGIFTLLSLAFVAGWLVSLAAEPAYKEWNGRFYATAVLKIEKVAGFKVTPDVAHDLTELEKFVSSHSLPGQKIFVGQNRNDIIIIGDPLLYFILDRPPATRYQELHPAITDTHKVQEEIISDLERQNVQLIVLKNIFPDAVLDKFKKTLVQHVPSVGATELDEYIQRNYDRVYQVGPYTVKIKKNGAN